MNRNIKELLCVSAVIGAATMGVTFADGLTVSDGNTNDVNSNTSYDNVTVSSDSKLNVVSPAKLSVSDTLENSGTVENSGTISVENDLTNSGNIKNTGSISSGKLTNNSGNKIEGSGSLTVKGGTNSGTITQNTLTNNSAKFTNSGTINATVENNNAFDNGSTTNTTATVGAVNNNAGGTFDNYASVTGNVDNKGTFRNKSGATVGTTSTPVTVTNSKSFTNDGTINGSVTNNTNGNFANNNSITGAVTNNAIFTNGSSSNKTATVGAVNNNAGGTFDNYASVTGNVDNKGTFRNESGAAIGTTSTPVTVTNSKDFTNDGTINGSVTNNTNGNFTNNNSITGAVTNNATFANGSSSNKTATVGTVNNNAGGTFDNYASVTGNVDNKGTFRNKSGAAIGTQSANATVTNSNSFTNDGTINGSVINNANTDTNITSTFTNNNSITGSVENNATFTNGSSTNRTAAVGQVTNNSGATFNNNASITGRVDNEGTFRNNSGATIGAASTPVAVANSKSFTNDGTINGSVTNSTANGNFTNNSAITGAITNELNATFTNNTNGKIGTNGTTDSAVAVTNGGTFTNNGKIVTSALNNTGSISGSNNGKTGSLKITGTSTAGNLTQNIIEVTGGTLTANGTINANTFNNSATVSGSTGYGSLTLTSGTNTGTISQNSITVSGGTFTTTGSNASVSAATLTNNGTIELVDGANLTTSNGLGGTVNVKVNSSTPATLADDDAVVSDIEIGNGRDFTGTLNVESGATGNVKSGNVASSAVVSIASTGALNIDNSNSTVNLNGSGTGTDDWSGTVNLKNGTLTVGGFNANKTNGVLNATGGTLDISSGILDIGEGSSIADTVNTLVGTEGTLKVSKGTVTFDKNGSNSWEGTVNVNGGTLNVANFTAEAPNGKLEADSGNVNINSGTLTVSTQSYIESDVNTTISNGANLDIKGGRVTLDGNDTWNDTGVVNLSSGTLNIGGTDIDGLASNGVLKAEGGTLNLKSGTLTINTGSSIANGVETIIEQNGNLDIKAGTVTLDKVTEDSWEGTVSVNGGTLNFDNLDSNGVLDAQTGAVNIQNGTLNIVGDSVIKKEVATTITGDLSIAGGEVTLDSNDTWNGTVYLLDDGKLTIYGPAKTLKDDQLVDGNGTLVATNGVLDVKSGDLNIGEGSSILGDVELTTAGNIGITDGGVVYIDKNDTLNGGAIVTLKEGGTLYYGKDDEDAAAKIDAEAGNLHLLSGSKLTLSGDSMIKDAVALDIQGPSTQNGETLEAAVLTLDGDITLNLDNLDTWAGKIVNENGVINTNGLTKTYSTASLIQGNGGTLNLYDGSSVILGSNSVIEGGNINITREKQPNLEGGTLEGETPDQEIGSVGSVLTTVDAKITGGDMKIDKYSKFKVLSGTFALDSLSATSETLENGVVNASLVDVMNGQRNVSSFGTVQVAEGEQANFNIDIHARSNIKTSNDQFVIGNLVGVTDGTSVDEPNAGILKINDWTLNGDIYGWDAPIDRHIRLSDVFIDGKNVALMDNIAVTDKTTFTPIGWYQLNKNEKYELDPTTGLPIVNPDGTKNHIGSYYTLDLVKYNPQVFRGQVATLAQWMNQLSINDMLFTHSMVLPSFKEADGGKMANRLAADSPLFAPYQYSRKEGGLWYKMYGTFENLEMNNNVGRVGNNAYGALIGADFGLKELRNGWTFMPTAYVGYNGAHQTFARVGQYQNGGQAGFLGTWYKDNFIVGALAYGGIYDNSMDVHGTTDQTFNYFAGGATKLAYNVRLAKNWVLQPNLYASYNYIGQQNWRSAFGQMGMMAGQLNGVNVAPGVNLIWERDTFSAYATLQYMYNVNGACGGRAGHVGLPKMEMERGFIQYGLGINKKFTDRFSGYLQAVLRNVGRTGVGFQAGFNFYLGK